MRACAPKSRCFKTSHHTASLYLKHLQASCAVLCCAYSLLRKAQAFYCVVTPCPIVSTCHVLCDVCSPLTRRRLRVILGLMTDETPSQFTRETWRAGRDRASYPRVRHWGGQTKAPDAFVAARNALGPGFAPGAPRCAHCARPAMRQSPVCRQHGGARWASRLRPFLARNRKVFVNGAQTDTEAP